MQLKILSYNLHKGYHWMGHRHVLKDMKELLHKWQSDIVFLQELRGAMSGEEAQLEFLADTLWTHHSYGKNAVYPKGHHGNAIMSKYPILSQENVDLSTNRFERRSLLHVSVNLNPQEGSGALVKEQKLHLLCTHLNLLEKSRLKQSEKILQWIDDHCPPNDPLILAGDFNDWTQKAHKLFTAAGLVEAFESTHAQCAASFPSIAPTLRLDRIYLRHVKCESSETPAILLSDHNPLCAKLKLDLGACP